MSASDPQTAFPEYRSSYPITTDSTEARAMDTYNRVCFEEAIFAVRDGVVAGVSGVERLEKPRLNDPIVRPSVGQLALRDLSCRP